MILTKQLVQSVLRLVLDTNILISSLINKGSAPYHLYKAWDDGDYALITSQEQLNELERVLSYPKLKRYFSVLEAGIFLKGLHSTATFAHNLPHVEYSQDATDNLIIATAIAGNADYLVTGDKRDLLHLQNVESVSIVTARQAIELMAL